MSRLAERFIEQGIQQSMQQGEARILIRLLQRKFGDLPEDIRQRIEAADVDTLLVWSDRVLTARNLEEVVRS
ncbi:MAG: hypothetical protein Kow0060_22620 [Methylohalobius crimeensis]